MSDPTPTCTTIPVYVTGPIPTVTGYSSRKNREKDFSLGTPFLCLVERSGGEASEKGRKGKWTGGKKDTESPDETPTTTVRN